MSPRKTTRNQGAEEMGPMDIEGLDPALRDQQEPHRSPTPPSQHFTLAAAEAHGHDHDTTEIDELMTPPTQEHEAGPLSDFARQVIESENPMMEHGEDEDAEELFQPEAEEGMELVAAVQAIEAVEAEDLRLLRGEKAGGNAKAGPSAPGPKRRGKAGQASGGGGTGKRKRGGTNGSLVPEEQRDLSRMKKDSHKEVERKRRDLINEGITALSKCLPPGSEKMGKGQILSMAANMLTDMAAGRPVNTGGSRGQDDEVISALQSDLANAQAQLEEEHTRSMTLETSWREAEDRAAASQFELERVKRELEEAKMQLLENRR